MPDTVVRGSRKTQSQKARPASFLAGGGEMGRRMRALDWSQTPLGDIERWPASLRTAVRILLTTRQPILLFWGERAVTVYNDAAKGVVASKHPNILGHSAASAWQDLWQAIGARVEELRRKGEAAYDEATLLPVESGGETNLARFAVSYTPVPEEDGAPGGVLCILNETESFHEAVIGLSSELDLEALLQKITDVATRVTRARFGAFFYNSRDGDGESFRLFTLSGADRAAFEKFGMPRATPIFKPTFDGEAPIRLDDVTRDPRYGKAAPHHGMPKGHLPVRSYLAVPVIARTGEVLGGLFFGHPEPGMFDERAERNARAIAAHAGVAIDNASLFAIARKEIEERSRVEIALRDSERRYRDVVEGLAAAVYTTDADGRIAMHNEAARKLWGRTPEPGERLTGAHRLADLEGNEIPRDQTIMARVLDGETFEGSEEVLIERPDGSRRHAIVHPRPLRDGSGALVGALNMVVDITEHKRAEQELAATRDELAAQLDIVKGLHALATKIARLDDGDEALRAILETAVSLQGAQFGSINLHDRARNLLVLKASVGFDAETLGEVEAMQVGVGNGSCGTCFAAKVPVTVLDTESDPLFESMRPFARRAGFRAVHSTPIVTRGGTLLGVLSVHYKRSRTPSPRETQLAELCARHAADAIGHFQSRRALEESERLYRAIGESINYGVWVCDEKGDNLYVSDSFLKLTGLTQASYARSIWSECLHPDNAEQVRAQWKETIASGRDWEAQVQVKTAAGGYRAILSRGVAMRDEEGRITGWAGMNLDIDRLKRVENELRELDQRKNEFLATLAHELRNPLAPIRNGLEIMRLGRGNPGMVEQARTMMERQLHQMVRLVDDLLDVSRVSRGKIELRTARIELSAALANAIETSKPLIDHNGQVLVANIPAESIPLDGDLTRLSQVFANLLNNAAKYSERGGRIEIDVRPAGNTVEVRVRDEGIGIPKEALGRIFDIFTQVERSLEKARGGLGIGLSIARRLVEMHGGTITALSEGPGTGSEFVVRLPIAGAAATEERREAKEEVPRSRRRVLVADDNVDAASSLSMMLQVMGHEVRVAHDGQEALAVAEAFQPDAVLLDIGMPVLNGYEACRKLREKSAASCPYIVALTGWGQEEDRKRSREFGFDQHLVKPVEPRTLEAILARLGKA